jgi:hypothetical protein
MSWLHLAALAALTLCACVAAEPRRPIPATYWLRAGAEPPPTVEVHEHPCGLTATAAFFAVPIGPGAFEAEFVHEVDSHGSVLRSWAVPIDRVPLAVSEHSLLLTEPGSPTTALVVGPGGELSIRGNPTHRVPIPSWCPDHLVGTRSAYLRCVAVPDLDSEEERILAFEGPCT